MTNKILHNNHILLISLAIVSLLLLISPVAASDLSAGDKDIDVYNNQQSFSMREYSIPITMTNLVNGMSGYNLEFSSADTDIFIMTGITFPAAFEEYGSYYFDTSNYLVVTGLDYDDVVDVGDPSEILCYVTVYWLTEGAANLEISEIQVDDDDGEPVSLAITDGLLTISFVGNEVVSTWNPNIDMEFDGEISYNIDNGTYTQYWLPETMNTGTFPFYAFALQV